MEEIMNESGVFAVVILFVLLGTIERWLPVLQTLVLMILLIGRSIMGPPEEEKEGG
jgi:hypothetical protein